MTRAAVGYPWANHQSLAVQWGLAQPEPEPTPAERAKALAEVIGYCALAGTALRRGWPVLAAARYDDAEKIAQKFKVAWHDPAHVSDPREARHG